MIEANNTDKGKTNGIILGIENNKNFTTIKKSKSLPANSEMNNQTVCSIKMKNKITKTDVKVAKNDFNK